MFRNRKSYSSSNHRRGSRRFAGPSSNGNFSAGRNFSRNRFTGRMQRSLPNDPGLFTQKASDNTFINEYTPKNSFESFNLSPILKSNIARKGYTILTPIQDQAITPILAGRDLIGLANTGTGKTAAFLVPIIDKIFRTRREKAIIITPTRELAGQINEEVKSFAAGMQVYSTLVIGGAGMRQQINDLRRNPHIIIGTPGRLRDLIGQRVLYLEDFSIFVLDEVDLMVDIGFIEDVKYFISLLPRERQSLFFSATISPKVGGILKAFVKDPVTVTVKKQDTSENVDQDVIRITSRETKVDQLHNLLIQEGFDKVLIFGRTKHGIEKLNKELNIRGFKVGAIHGNKKQGQRQRVLQSFKQNQIKILLATDLASRGLDIDNVTHVINYDLPENYEDYIHRIGRTGRANRKGIALTFIESN